MIADLRYAIRMLLKTPAFTVGAVLCLALGIGANTATFSFVDSFLFRPLPVPNASQIVVLTGPGLPCSYADYEYYRDHNEVFSGLLASSADMLSLGKGSQKERILAELVSGNYFSVLGVKVSLGRTFLPEEDHAAPQGVSSGLRAYGSAVVSHSLWKRTFGSDPNLVGKAITLDDRDYLIVGIAPERFHGLQDPFMPDVWVPVPVRAGAGDGIWGLAGRLRPGVTRGQAQAAMNVIEGQLRQAHPEQQGQRQGRWLVVPRRGVGGPVRPMVASVGALLMAVVGLVLLIACGNVANLLLARAAVRRREIAIRLALGASRRRLIRQLLTESLLLAGLGAAGGLLLAGWAGGLLAGLMPSIISAGFAVDHGIGLRVLGFTALLSLLTALLFGLAPTLQASRPDLFPALKDEVGLAGRSPRRPLGELLVVAQLALSLVVLIATGLFVRSLQRAQTMDVGFVTKSLIVAQVDLGRRRHPEAQVREFYRRLKERVESLPGVRFAGLTDVVPLGNKSRDADIVVEGSESATVAVGTSFVDPQYFQTMGIPVLRGRNFSEQDGEANPSTAVIISEAMARRFWPGESPLGKRLWLGRVRLEVIGVVRDSKYGYLAEAPRPYMYRPGAPGAAMNLVVRTAGDPEPTIGVLRREIESAGGGLVQAAQVKTMTEHLDPLLGPMRSGAEALAIFSLLAIVLTAVGIYGVMAYAVVRRTREIGIRMALGADAGDVLKLVAGRGMTLAMIGVAFGLAAAFAVTRLLVSFLYGVSATDPKAFIGASLLCMLVALLASYIPARNATKLDPMAALRHE